MIPESDRIVTIEDAAELQLHQRHVLRLEARPKNIEGEGEIAIRELVRNSLRMRPDRIIVGEVRGAEALDMLQAMNTGHDGSLSTVHSNSPRDALHRVETMVMMAGLELPVRAIRQQVASALDLIIHLERLEDGSRRVTHITEVQRMESDVITLQDIFEFKLESIGIDRTITGCAAAHRPAARGAAEVREARDRAPLQHLRHRRRGSSRSMRQRLFAAAAVAALFALCTGSAVAAAASAPKLTPTKASSFPNRSYILSFPNATHVATEGVSVFENGQPVNDLLVELPGQTPGSATVGVVLLIDASLSMQGEPIKQAMVAARAFASNRASQEQLAALFFNTGTKVALPLTNNDGEVLAALSKTPRLAFGTHINDAVQEAVKLLDSANVDIGSIVLLSDGRDVGSVSSEADAIADAARAHARVFSVGLRSSPSRRPR